LVELGKPASLAFGVNHRHDATAGNLLAAGPAAVSAGRIVAPVEDRGDGQVVCLREMRNIRNICNTVDFTG
jgi:hypothetical protein